MNENYENDDEMNKGRQERKKIEDDRNRKQTNQEIQKQ